MYHLLWMGRVLLLSSFLALSILSVANAQPGDITLAAGILAPYDADTGKSAVGWNLSYAVGITDRLELGAMFTRSGNYKAVNPLTSGEVEVSTLIIQARWFMGPMGATQAFIDLGGGMMDLDPKGGVSGENRAGAAARVGVGIDRTLGPVDLRLGLGYTRGIGRTSEIDMLEAFAAIVFGAKNASR
ncbi:MAG: hypothetical protein MI742_02720 [Desulfobacterales bacterium]|nr:hypothetical protein [Desulfobacterales bacterium]